jgi:hypothetical protein
MEERAGAAENCDKKRGLAGAACRHHWIPLRQVGTIAERPSCHSIDCRQWALFSEFHEDAAGGLLRHSERRRSRMIWIALLMTMVTSFDSIAGTSLAAVPEDDTQGWKLYTNARFGFSVRYPNDWRLGNPLPDGTGVTLYPPIDHSLVAVSGHMNVLEGKSQDGRQTLDEFAAAHRRIITELYAKKTITATWRQDQELALAGFPAKQLIFTYSDDTQGEMIEHHIFSLGRNEGRGVRIKAPLSADDRLMPTVKKMLQTYRPGRDQNAVSPVAPVPR